MSSQVANLSLKQRLTLIDLEQIFHDIRVALEDELSRQPSGFLANVMLPPQQISEVNYKTLFFLMIMCMPSIYLFLLGGPSCITCFS